MKQLSKIRPGLVPLIILLILASQVLLAQAVKYESHPAYVKKLKALADDFSKLVKLESKGKTTDGNDIWLVRLGSGEQDSKPAILLAGGVNGSDLSGSEILYAFIQHAAENYGKTDSITKMLDKTTFYIFPNVNPDASMSLSQTPSYRRSLNGKKMDLDKDGRIDEDGFEDLNKDGFITFMRVTEAGGTWMEDPDFPGLMKQADPGKSETGIYSLYREGIDNDGDGRLNEDEPGGVDFNKNFTFRYQFFETGSGDHPVSEIESRAVADFAYARTNIAAVFCFSENDNLIHPWEPSAKAGSASEGQNKLVEVAREDAAYYKYISDTFKSLTGHSKSGPDVRANGAFSDWIYFHYGRWSFSTPAWTPPAVAAKDSLQDRKSADGGKQDNPAVKPEQNYEQRLFTWLSANDRQDDLLAWREIKHPDFPDKKVEIGGFKPEIYTNPPADSLKSVSSMYFPFFIKLAEWLPAIAIEDLSVKKLETTVHRLTLKIVNKGYLPSNPRAAVSNKWAPKIKVSLSLADGQKLAGGSILSFVDYLPGGGASKEISWVILAKPGQTVQVEAGSPMTGVIKKSVKLQ